MAEVTKFDGKSSRSFVMYRAWAQFGGGHRGHVPTTFLEGGITCHVPPLFSLKVCIWRGFKTKYDVCHVLCEEFFTLDHGRNLEGDVSPRFFKWGGYSIPCPPTFSLQVLHLEKFQK